MSAQAVARFTVFDDVCPDCRSLTKVYVFSAAVDGLVGEHSNATEGCLNCLFERHGGVVENSETIRIRDVIETDTRGAGRARVKAAQRRELRAAEQIAGKTVAGSGSGEAKGDARNEHWMVEDKGTTAASYRLTRQTIAKAVGQASQTGRKAVIKVGLNDGTEFAVMLWTDIQEVIRGSD